MKRSIFQFYSLLRLSACFFALVCFSSVGYASSEADNVHFCLPFESEGERDSHQYVARKQALNLNVGEPRTVRLIYFLPNDRSFNEEVVQNMKDEIRNIQTFYAEQMRARGYGDKTFRVETDAQGEPMVHRVDGQYPDSHYSDDRFISEKGEIEEIYDLDENIYFIVIDNSRGTPAIGVAGRGGRQGENGGTAMFPSGFSWRTAAHELGHAFGLAHDFNSDAYMMSYGSHRERLSAGSAEYLTVHPYFNSGTPSSTGTGAQGAEPTIELMSSTGYPFGSNRVSVQLKISDTEGLHQVILFVYTPEPHPSAGFREVKTFRGLGGEKDAVVEFDYDGVIPSLGYTSLSDPPTHPIGVMVVDTDGNVSHQFLGLSEISPYHIATLEGHTKMVGSIAFSPDGTIFASGSDDGTIRLWDVATGEYITTLEGHTGEVTSLAFSPDGTTLASFSYDHKVKLWDVSAGENIATFKTVTTVFSFFFLSDGTLLGAGPGDKKIRLWDVATGESITTLEERTNLVFSMASLALSPDGTLLASGSWDDKMVRLWDVVTGEHIATFEGHEQEVTSIAFSPDGTILASGSPDDTVRLWGVSTRTAIGTAKHGSRLDCSGVWSIAFSPDGTILAASVSDKTGTGTRLWNVATRTTIARFQGYGLLRTIAFSPDGARLVTGSWHGEIELWNTSEWVRTLRPQTLEKISGDNQQGKLSAVLANSYVVEVRDQDGNPLQGAQVTFTVAAGDGKLSGRFSVENVTTDANGRAQSTFRLGSNAGTNIVRASIGEMEVIFDATGIETSITPVIGGAYQKWHLPDGATARLGKGRIGDVAFSPDGHRFAVASDIGIWLYDVATSRELALLTGHTRGINAVAFSPNSTKLASGSYDNTVKVWDVSTGENITTLEGHTSWIFSVAFSPDGTTIASGSYDNTVKVWDVSTGENIATLEGHTDNVNTIAFSSDGTLASGSDDLTVKLWDVATQTNIATLEGHWDQISSVVFSPDGTILASGGADNGTLKLWDVATGETIASYRYVVPFFGGDNIHSIVFSPDGATFVVATSNYVKLWDVVTGKNVGIVEGHMGARSIAFSPDGTTLALNSNGDTVKLWEIATQNISILEGHKPRIRAMAFSPNGAILASGSEYMIELWDVATGANIATLEGRLSSLSSVAFSSDGKMLAADSSLGIVLWDVSRRTTIATLDDTRTVQSVAFSPNGTTLASGHFDGIVKLWDVATRTNIATIEEGHKGWVSSVVFSPDGTTLASAGSHKNESIRLWDVAKKENIATLEGHTSGIRSIAFSPDGTLLASGSNDNTIKLWDVATRTDIATFKGSGSSVAFSPDGKMLAADSSSGITLWDIATKTDVVTLEGHNRINSIVFSPDGTTLASGAEDGTALLWDMSGYVTPVVTGVPVVPDKSPTADFDGNGTVGISDFLLFAVQFGLSQGDAGYDARFDLDGDGTIGISDFLIFGNAFGT